MINSLVYLLRMYIFNYSVCYNRHKRKAKLELNWGRRAFFPKREPRKHGFFWKKKIKIRWCNRCRVIFKWKMWRRRLLCVFVVCLWGGGWVGFFLRVCAVEKKNVRNFSVFFSGQEFESMSVICS